MLIEKDTKEATSKFFAVADIDARAAAAYTANKQLFNSVQHITKVELVDSIVKSMFIGYATAYQTSRAATSKRAAHTEVKYFRVVTYAANKQLFNSKQHTTKVELVDSIVKSIFVGYATAYQTSRAATSKRAAHTEVKYFRVVTYAQKQHSKLKALAVQQLAALGLDLVYKPRTDSYSVHVI